MQVPPGAAKVLATKLPLNSVLDGRWVATAYFSDAYCVRLARHEATLPEIFSAIFMHMPPWMKAVLMLRNALARRCGLQAPTAAQLLHPAMPANCCAGDTIGVWPVFALTRDELIAGRDNKHLDFRLSLLKQVQGSEARVTVSTVCQVHNFAGKLYLFFIVPFHRWGVQRLLANAVAAGRL